MRSTLPCSTATLLMLTSVSHAAVLTDNFSDGDRTTNAAWYYATGSAAPTVSTNGVRQNLLVDASVGNNAPVWTTFSSTTLAVGQTLKVSFNFDVSGGAGNNGDAPLRVGFYNVASPVNADQDSAGGGIANANWNGATGYGAFVGAVNAGTTLTGSTTNFRQRTGANNTLWAGAAHTGITTNVTGAVPVALGTADLTASPLRYTIEYTMTRSGTDTMELFFSLSDGSGQIQTLSATDGSGVESTFNTLSIFAGGVAGQDMAIDNVVVDVVPEPGAVLMGGMSVALLLLRRTKC